MKKLREKICVLLVGVFILGFMPMNGEAEIWKQTNSSDFQGGELVGVKIENGTLKLDFAPLIG